MRLPRYRLRSLLIAVAVAALVFALVARLSGRTDGPALLALFGLVPLAIAGPEVSLIVWEAADRDQPPD